MQRTARPLDRTGYNSSDAGGIGANLLAIRQGFGRSAVLSESANWIPSFHIGYGMGVDGISLPFLFPASLLSILLR
jgi:NADH:ubiquinone oxidoreductase subunit 4 (subunit M)